MLVLSRRIDQKVVFPNVGITLSVLKVRGQVVKLGIDAPDDVEILRPEAKNRPSHLPKAAPRLNRHDLKGRVNNLRLALAVFDRQRELGRDEDAERTFQRLIKLLSDLDAELSGTDTPQAESAPQNGSSRARLLVVDDDDNERELLAGLLRLYGYEVDVAANGVEALEALEKNTSPDLVLLDVNMPQKNGMEVVEQIRNDQRFAELPVFAVSGVDPSAMGGTGRELSRFTGWFQKPVDPARLLTAISGTRHAPTQL